MSSCAKVGGVSSVTVPATGRRRPRGGSRRRARAHRRLLVGLLGVAVALGVVGCRVSSDEKPTAPVCAEPGVTPDAVRLGLLYPDTGNAASLFAPFRAGVDARLGVADAAGGVGGRQVRYTWRDDASNPAGNEAGARALVQTDRVFGLIESTSVASGSAAYLHGARVPVTGTSLEAAWTQNDNMFSYSNMISDGPSVTTWGAFVAERGGRTAVIAQSAFSATSMTMADKLALSLQAAGIRVVGRVDATGPIDIPGIGEKVRASGADVLVGAVTGAAFGQVVVGARAAHANLRVILSPVSYDQRLLRVFGPVLAGLYTFVDYQPFEVGTPAHQRFLAGMLKYAPQVSPPAQQAALSGWISADMFLRGLAAAGPCPSRESFIRGLRGLKGYDADGLLPAPIDFSSHFGQINRCYTFLQVTADAQHFELVPPAPRCGDEIGQ
ncbi:amino acid/amide ABC transporter substrate-binding protein, HAAT family [Frankia torreyi]|uniref:Amino acid/amide ABC transporter substrate-binding protein, HAAT family n=1 Tax=Frankia torreyi TaxID=1856 RepID=A0A0D8BMA8_9ACTN|nr:MULTISPECIES: ABC transporter substrate-binding protein [Frankia]KJE24582.1 amino acid/amide ABC transporter substrate-binding protein, HAAT family [Frankia torreyi]KQC37604.1 branched-chain amino acid ABC transporter substrate-binding protein [Frankia sp. ACN1ag]KQM07713.1 amino acid/amide ABC transporter substrate-binding protein, HAAT family [Frankia sp. CpI1-P]